MSEGAAPGAPGAARPTISVVVPAYGCVGTLAPLHARLVAVLEGLIAAAEIADFEVVFVDDRGRQDQGPVLAALAAADPRVRVLRMARNHGQQLAITAGLAEARGDFAVVMDCDLQDPPEFIPALWRAAKAGYGVVYAGRRQGDPAARRLLNRLYFRAMRLATGYEADPSQGSFSLLSRQVIDAFLLFRERERHYLSILRWLGFDSVTLTYERHERTVGESSYTLGALLRHAAQGFFFQSTALLMWILWLGLVTAGVSVALALWFALNALMGQPPEGFTALITVQLLIGGVTLTCLGGVGLYIARIFEEVKGRPLYVVDRAPAPRPLPPEG